MGKYEEFIKRLQEDIEVPANVSEKFRNTLDNLPDAPAEIFTGNKKSKTWLKVAVGTTVILALSAKIYADNPALAAKIPFIGKIFESVENDVTFSGDYKDKAQKLIPETNGLNTEITKTNEINETISYANTNYSAENNGVKVTASEVYSDGFSLFITFEVKSEKGGFEKMTAHYTSGYGDTTANYMYTEGEWNLLNEEKIEFANNFIEGKVVDDNTLIGMMKIDFKNIENENGIFNLDFSRFGFDRIDAPITDGIEISEIIEGEWKLSIPYEIDKDAELIEVNEKNEAGFGVKKVLVSPYQIIVYSDAPYTIRTPEEFTEEEFTEIWGDTNEWLKSVGDEPISYEEELNRKQYAEFDLSVFNQDNEFLEFQESSVVNDEWISKFAVKGLEISRVKIFIKDEYLSLIKIRDVDEAQKKCVWSGEVTVK